MSLYQHPFKLLEITVISAQDLPPVSKMLRTFAVVYIHPDHKLTTKVDHKGKTNPTWNYKVAFLVDDSFLRSENPVVTIEIYNVAWLRDLPIGTTHLPINSISPRFTKKDQSKRNVSLQISRPSGQMQGTLNLAVSLIGNRFVDDISGSELSISTIRNNDAEIRDQNQEESNNFIRDVSDKNSNFSPISEKMIRKLIPSEPDLQIDTKSFIASTNASMFSVMKPLPSEVAAYLKSGLFSAQGDIEYGSSVFENWSLPGESEAGRMKSVGNIEEMKEDKVPLMNTDVLKGTKKLKGFHRRGQNSNGKGKGKGKGLFSCFGNFIGFTFSFSCGGSNMKKNRKNKQNFSEGNHRRMY